MNTIFVASRAELRPAEVAKTSAVNVRFRFNSQGNHHGQDHNGSFGGTNTRQSMIRRTESAHLTDLAELPTDATAQDRRASWQRLPNVTVAPRHRRKFVVATTDNDSLVRGIAMDPWHGNSTKDPSDDEDVNSIDKISTREPSTSPDTTNDYNTSATRSSQRLKKMNRDTLRNSHSTEPRCRTSIHNEEISGKAISPKLRRKLTTNTPVISDVGYPVHMPLHCESPSTLEDSKLTGTRIFNVPTVDDAIHSETSTPVDANEAGAGGKRRRQVPDNMQTIACYFCRRRKIKCGPPEGDVKSCPPCAKRQLPCEYAEKSNRGMRTDLIRKKQAAQSMAEDVAAAHAVIEVAEKVAAAARAASSKTTPIATTAFAA